MIVLCKIDSCLIHCCSLLKYLNQNLNLKFHQIDFWFEFLNIHMNENIVTCHDCHGFKWQNINVYPILIICFCNLTRFLVCWIVTAPTPRVHVHLLMFLWYPIKRMLFQVYRLWNPSLQLLGQESFLVIYVMKNIDFWNFVKVSTFFK